jgi:hypothetical protein
VTRFPINFGNMFTKSAKAHAGRAPLKAEAVVAINMGQSTPIYTPDARAHQGLRQGIEMRSLLCTGLWLVVFLLATVPAVAAVLPEDRADLQYHYYDGGGTEVKGPALLVRKDFASKASLSASYYTDTVSGASIDVVTTASPYEDKRKEHGLGLDYLHQNTLMHVSYKTSEENDYLADTVNLNVSHEMFGGLTTVSLGYTKGEDVVKRVDNEFKADIDRHQYRLGVSQVLTKSLVVSLDYENITEEGFLNNPYRSAMLFLDCAAPPCIFATVPERYPRTRTSQALAFRAVKGLQAEEGSLGSSIRFNYRFYRDTWDIRANTLELGYQRYFGRRWLGEAYYRHYSQDKASFYNDSFSEELNFMARDKELSTFTSRSVGAKASYTLTGEPKALSKATLNLAYERIHFEYDDFTDVRTGRLYAFDADVIQFFLSLWY